MKKPKQQVKEYFPPGWNEKRVKEVIAHYDRLTEYERAAEIETAEEAEGETVMLIPNELVPQVSKLIARHQKTA